MKEGFTTLGVLGAILGLVWWFSKEQHLANQSFFQLDRISFSPGIVNDNLIIHGKIINPSNGQIQFKSFTGELLYHSTPLGKMLYLGPIAVPPISQTPVDIQMTVSNRKVFEAAPNLLRDLKSGISLKAKGIVNTSLGAFQIENDVPVI